MDVIITGKSINVTPALRSYVENKLQRIFRIIKDVMDVHVTLSVQKHLQSVDITVKTRNSIFTSHGRTSDMYASINEGMDSLLRQAKRQNKKMKSHKGRKRGDITELIQESAVEIVEEDKSSNTPPSILRESMSIKPLSLEEAMLQIEAAENGFLLFRNANTAELNLIYKRKDGKLGLIETSQ